ncbi:MAG TPA: transcriptional regulator AsnC, partial [Bacteroidetes bacterium]|nr:transcriptional regulator AsnC [Bacteroidota bacterium]
VVECHYTTGIYSIFAKLYCRDTSHLREVLNDKVQAIPSVQRTETLISLEETFERQIVLGDE